MLVQMEKRLDFFIPLLGIVLFAVFFISLSGSHFQSYTGAIAIPCFNPPCGGDDSGTVNGGNTGNNGSGNGPEPPGLCPGENFSPSQTKRCVEPGWETKNDSFIEMNNIPYCCYGPATEFCDSSGECQPRKCPKEGEASDQTGLCRIGVAEDKPEEELNQDEYCCYNPEIETCNENVGCKPKTLVCAPPEYPPAQNAVCKTFAANDKREAQLQEGDFCCYNPAAQSCENWQCLTKCNDNGAHATQISCMQFSEDGKVLNKWCCPKYQVKKTLFGNKYRFYSCGGAKDPPNSCFLMNELSEEDLKKCQSWMKDHGINCLDAENLPTKCPVCPDGKAPDLYLMAGTVISEQYNRDFAMSACNNFNKGNGGNCSYFLYINSHSLGWIIPKLRNCFWNVTIDVHGRVSGGEGWGTQAGAVINYAKLLKGKGTLFALSCQLGKTKNEDGIPDSAISFCMGAQVDAVIVLSEANVCTDSYLCTTGNFSCYQCTNTRENADAKKLPGCAGVDFGVVKNTG